MSLTTVWRKCQVALCCLGLVVGSFTTHGQAAKSKNRRDDGRRIAARQVLNRAVELRAELSQRTRRDRPPYNDHRHHLYAHVQAGKEKWELIGSPSGVFPIIVHQHDKTVDFNLYIPTTPLGQAAEITVIDDGKVSPFHGLVGRKSSEKDARVRASSRAKGNGKSRRKAGKKNIAVAAGPNGRISFSFHYGEGLHAQRIEIRTPQKRVFFNLHLHPPGFDDH